MENKPVIIFGAGGLGKVAQEIFDSHDIVVFCFLDDRDDLIDTEIGEVAVLGKMDDEGYTKYIGKKCEAFVALDDNADRKAVVKMLHDRRKVQPMNAVHSTGHISRSASMGYGNMVNMGAKIGSHAELGSHCLIHANALVDYNCKLADFVQVGAGSILNGGVEVGKNAFIGSGVTIVSGIKIGKNARVGAGSVVVKDVKDGETVFGNPAEKI